MNFVYRFSRLNARIFNSDAGTRIDRYLVNELNRNWNDVQKLIRNGEIGVNDKKIKNHQFVLQEGDIISYWDKLKKDHEQSERPIPTASAYEELKKMILYENDQIIILNKKHGYASQGGAIPQYNIPEILNLYFRNFYIIHRLDQLTSGLLIIAKDKQTAVEVGRLFQEKVHISKKYLAVVQGTPLSPEGLIDRPLQFNTNSQKQIIYKEGAEGKFLSARTEYKVIQQMKYEDECYSLLEVRIYEGRKHQIRAHLDQVLQTPILFDQKYGFQFTKTNRELQKKVFGENQGIALQAKKISFKMFPFEINETFFKNENGTLLQKNGELLIEVTTSSEIESLINDCQN